MHLNYTFLKSQKQGCQDGRRSLDGLLTNSMHDDDATVK